MWKFDENPMFYSAGLQQNKINVIKVPQYSDITMAKPRYGMTPWSKSGLLNLMA